MIVGGGGGLRTQLRGSAHEGRVCTSSSASGQKHDTKRTQSNHVKHSSFELVECSCNSPRLAPYEPLAVRRQRLGLLLRTIALGIRLSTVLQASGVRLTTDSRAILRDFLGSSDIWIRLSWQQRGASALEKITRERGAAAPARLRSLPEMSRPVEWRLRHAAARSAPHCRQRQRVPRSAGTTLSGVSSWPLPQRVGAKTLSDGPFGANRGVIEFGPKHAPISPHAARRSALLLRKLAVACPD
jgi:hypothetical protein